MSIRRMLFPLFVIILAFVAVNFIRPAILSVLDQRTMKETKLAELAAVEKTAANIGSLSDARKKLLGSEDGRMIMSYLPTKPDHDRIVDIFNFFGLQSGAIIGDIAFEKNVAVAAPVADVSSEVVAADGTVIETPPAAPLPSVFSVTVEMSGAYDSLKSFMDRVSSMDRLEKVVSFSITKSNTETGASAGNPGQTAGEGELSAKLEVEFSYLPEASYPGAHLLPIFAAGEFDTASVLQAMGSNESIPVLPEPALPGRRSDPFKL